MKAKYIFWGTFFISIGILALLNNFATFHIAWTSLWKLWPLVIIFWGISLLINNQVVKNFISGIIAIALALSLYGAFSSTFNFVSDGFVFTIDDNKNYEFVEKKTYTEPYDKDFRNASLHLSAGAGKFIMNDTTYNLFDAEVEGSRMKYTLSRSDTDLKSNLEFSMNKAHFNLKNGRVKNHAEIKLNPKPVWDMEFDIGAAEVNFDLRPYKINDLDIETGAASVKVKLGDLSERINLDLNAGAADVDIYIPENSGCEIRTNAALSSKNFSGFTKIEDDLYRTENFDTANKKVYMILDAGVSSLSVIRESGW